MTNRINILLRVILLCYTLALAGCQGGGTQGTGVPKSIYTGRLTTTSDGAGFPGARVEISEAGTATQTNEHGIFTLETPTQTSTVTFIVTRDKFTATAVLDNPPISDKPVTVDILIDVENNSAEAKLITLTDVSKFDVKAYIVGACSRKFQTTKGEVRQISPLPNGITCIAHVEVRGDGNLRGGVKVAVQRKPCSTHAQWTTTEVRITDTRTKLGHATIPFRLFDTERACAYRIIAPYAQDSHSTEVLQIVTLAQVRNEQDGL